MVAIVGMRTLFFSPAGGVNATFYGNGNLQRCEAANDFFYDLDPWQKAHGGDPDVECRGRGTAWFNLRGSLRSCDARPGRYAADDGKLYDCRGDVVFNDGGDLNNFKSDCQVSNAHATALKAPEAVASAAPAKSVATDPPAFPHPAPASSSDRAPDSAYVLIVHKTLGIKSALGLSEASICGSKADAASLSAFFHIHEMKHAEVIFPNMDEAVNAFLNARCDAVYVPRDFDLRAFELYAQQANQLFRLDTNTRREGKAKAPNNETPVAEADQVWRTNSAQWGDIAFLEQFLKDYPASSEAVRARNILKELKQLNLSKQN